MTIATETASEYYTLAAKAADRGMINEALHYSERATELLLRPEAENVPTIRAARNLYAQRGQDFWLSSLVPTQTNAVVVADDA